MFVGYYLPFQVNSNQRDLVVEKLKTFCIKSTIGIYQNFMYITTKHPTTTANQNPIHFHQGYRCISSPSGSLNIRRFHIVAFNLSGSVGFVNRLITATTNREIMKITADRLNIFQSARIWKNSRRKTISSIGRARNRVTTAA